MSDHRLIHLFLRAIGGIRRRPWLHLLSVFTLTAAFLSFTASLTAAVNLDHLISRWIGSAEITVFLHEGTLDKDLKTLAAAVEKTDGVERVEAVPPKEALIRFEQEMGEIAATLPAGVFPPTLDVHMDEATARNPAARAALAARLGNVDVVEKVELYDDWFGRLSALSLVGRLAAWGLGFIALAVAVLVVTAVVRQGVSARAREIEVLQLVGATKAYVRAPFLIEGALETLLAMALAIFGLMFLTDAASEFAGEFLMMVGGSSIRQLTPTTILILLGGATLLGLVGARFSMRGQAIEQ